MRNASGRGRRLVITSIAETECAEYGGVTLVVRVARSQGRTEKFTLVFDRYDISRVVTQAATSARKHAEAAEAHRGSLEDELLRAIRKQAT